MAFCLPSAPIVITARQKVFHFKTIFSLLGGYPNTYTYTKAAGEDVLLKNCEGLPVAVFRPAIGRQPF